MSDSGIAGFELIEKIGDEGLSTIYKARQISLDRTVAFHILPPDTARSTEVIESFKADARTAASLNHPHLLQIHEAGDYEGIFFYVTEMVESESIAERMWNETHIPVDEAIAICVGVAEALKYGWERAQITHGGLTPASIFRDTDGSVKLANLGLNGVIKSGAADDENHTVNYSSPGTARGADIDHRADMYSLGACLYHMCTGVMPFADCEPSDVLAMQVNGHIQNPVELNPEISTGMSVVMRKLMAKEPEHNYTSWEEAITDLKRVHGGGKPLKPIHPAADSTIKTFNASGARSGGSKVVSTGGKKSFKIQPSSSSGKRGGKRRAAPKVTIAKKDAPAPAPSKAEPKIRIAKKESKTGPKISKSDTPQVNVAASPKVSIPGKGDSGEVAGREKGKIKINAGGTKSSGTHMPRSRSKRRKRASGPSPAVFIVAGVAVATLLVAFMALSDLAAPSSWGTDSGRTKRQHGLRTAAQKASPIRPV